MQIDYEQKGNIHTWSAVIGDFLYEVAGIETKEMPLKEMEERAKKIIEQKVNAN